MTLHLIKLAVGVSDVAHLARLQADRMRRAAAEPGAGEQPPRLLHITRNMPRRAAELLDGGSIYWVIRGFLQVGQRLLAVERTENARGRPSCALSLDPALMMVRPRRLRPFQGWRYLPAADAPAERGPFSEGAPEIPLAMTAELEKLGLI